MPYDSKESKYDDHSAEEVVSDNILPEFFEYIQSAKFQSQIEQFCEQHAHLFDGSEGKCSNTKEFTHEHKAIFDDYQALIDKLFSSFARDHRMEVADLYDCCRDTVEGKFSPLFQEENEYEYVVTTLLEFLDFNQFLKMMSSQKHTHKRSHK